MPMPVFLMSSPFTKSSNSSHGILVIIPAPSPLQAHSPPAHTHAPDICRQRPRSADKSAPAPAYSDCKQQSLKPFPLRQPHYDFRRFLLFADMCNKSRVV